MIMNAKRVVAGIFLSVSLATGVAKAADFRPRAVPLVTVDPFTSCWSMSARLYDDSPKHWTGKNFGMCGIIRVDGVARRFMGVWDGLKETVEQTTAQVWPTQTMYRFAGGGVTFALTLTTPLFVEDLGGMCRPGRYW